MSSVGLGVQNDSNEVGRRDVDGSLVGLIGELDKAVHVELVDDVGFAISLFFTITLSDSVETEHGSRVMFATGGVGGSSEGGGDKGGVDELVLDTKEPSSADVSSSESGLFSLFEEHGKGNGFRGSDFKRTGSSERDTLSLSFAFSECCRHGESS